MIHISEENYTLNRFMHADVHSSTIYNSQDMEPTEVFINK